MKTIKILIVEDSYADALTLAKLLETCGYVNIHFALSTADALKKADSLKPHIALINIGIHDYIKSIANAEHIKTSTDSAIIFTADAFNALTFSKAQSISPHGYLLKPINAENIHIAIDTALRRLELEIKLKNSFEIFKISIETMLDCFGIYSALRDASGKIIDFIIEYVNEPACANAHLERSNQIGQRLCEILPEQKSSGLFEEFCAVTETGQPMVKQSLVYEDNHGIKTLAKAFNIRAVKLKDGFAAAWRDITEQKKAEESLNLSEKKYSEIFDNLNEGLWLINNDLKTIFINKKMSSIIGYNKDELLERRILDFVSTTNYHVLHKMFETPVNNIKNETNCILINKSGQKIFTRISVSRLSDSLGNHVGFFAFFNQAEDIIEVEDSPGNRLRGDSEEYIVGKSKFMSDIYGILPTISESDCNVLIEGPSGAGKSFIAKTIHQLSDRSAKPFVVINCGALPETLIESELFGYAKGAFTDAKKDKPGRFMTADGGTILLDEISELALHLQVKLLHVIEEKRFEPLGSNVSQKANVRIIAATNKNLSELIKQNKFREDLYYRLKIVNLKVPPLCERPEDILVLTWHFIKKLNQKYNKNISGISEQMMKFLMKYHFPGNIRELYNILERAFIFSESNIIDVDKLSDEYNNYYNVKENLEHDANKSLDINKNTISPEPQPSSFTADPEKLELINALQNNKYNRNKTAEFLNISRMALWRRMKKHDLL